MAGDTKIRWASKTWNPASGCHKISAGCDHCYAFTLAEARRGTPSFPVGFDPVMKPHKINDPWKWKGAEHIFVNSMSDLFLGEWTTEFLDQVHDVMLACDRHVYIILTKRPRRMRDYYLGTQGDPLPVMHFGGLLGFANHYQMTTLRADGYLARRGLRQLPEHIWPGVTIESDLFAWRADVLRQIPALGARTISAEPLLTALPSLNLDGLGWVIVGGESGKGFRTMNDDWARDLRARCVAAAVPYFFKQHSAYRTEMGIELDGERIEQVPVLSRDREPRGQGGLL